MFITAIAFFYPTAIERPPGVAGIDTPVNEIRDDNHRVNYCENSMSIRQKKKKSREETRLHFLNETKL